MTSPEPISRESFARLYGGAGIAGGAVVLLLAWLVPNWLSDKVAKCNTVAGDLYGRSHAGTGAGCAAANFVTDYRWVFIILGIALVVIGLAAVFGANDPEVRQELDLD